jgi:hypothetical protein
MLRAKLHELDPLEYVIVDYMMDECLRGVLQITDKGIGKPPYEDYLSYQTDNYYELS